MENPTQKLNAEGKETLKQEYLADFIDFRNNYLDDLPREIVEQDDPNLERYKCRGNFWFGLSSRIIDLITEGIITSPEAIEKYQEFYAYQKSLKWDGENFRTQADIDYINEILDFFIKELSS